MHDTKHQPHEPGRGRHRAEDPTSHLPPVAGVLAAAAVATALAADLLLVTSGLTTTLLILTSLAANLSLVAAVCVTLTRRL